jgi:hypothetical protein
MLNPEATWSLRSPTEKAHPKCRLMGRHWDSGWARPAIMAGSGGKQAARCCLAAVSSLFLSRERAEELSIWGMSADILRPEGRGSA